MHMMIKNPREKGAQAKQEGGLNGGKDAGAMASSRTWTGLTDPRIVRVSRSLGGKDRHSKVSTVRGLRDRRVRLSVPTAIQLYDLQDRLGVNQPSKVVDWLLDAARHEIDKLPPLRIPPGSFLIQCPQSMAAAPNGVLGLLPEEEEEEEEEGGEDPSGVAAGMECAEARRRKGSARGSMEESIKDGLFPRMEQEQRVAEAHRMAIPDHGDHLHGQSHASMSSMLGRSGEHACYQMEAPHQLPVPHQLGCYPLSQGEELHGYRPANPPLTSMFSSYAAAAAGYDHHKHANSTLQMGASASQGFMLSYAPSALHSSSANINMRPLQVTISSRHHGHCQHNHDQSSTERLL